MSTDNLVVMILHFDAGDIVGVVVVVGLVVVFGFQLDMTNCSFLAFCRFCDVCNLPYIVLCQCNAQTESPEKEHIAG